VTIPAKKLSIAVLPTTPADFVKNQPVSITITPEGQAMDLDIEWFQGVRGDGEQTTNVDMWIIPDGNGSLSPNFSPIPDPLVESQPVRTDRTDMNQNMTWGEVKTLMAQTGGGSFSPGAGQSLVSTALSMVHTAEFLKPGVGAKLGISTATSAEQMLSSGWLNNPRNAMFASIVQIRYHYNVVATQFDLPRVHGWLFGSEDPKGKPTNAWGINSPKANRIDELARRYNACVDYFKTPLAPPLAVPTVRFSV